MYRQDDLDQKALDDKIRGKELWAETVKAQTERWKAEAIAKAALPADDKEEEDDEEDETDDDDDDTAGDD